MRLNFNCVTGHDDHLYKRIQQSFHTATSIDIIVSFLMESGVKLIQKETDENIEYSTKYKEPYEETIGIIWSGILKEQSEEKAIEEIQNDVNDILNENIKLSEREQITKYINMLKKRDLNKIAKVANDKIQSFRIYTA